MLILPLLIVLALQCAALPVTREVWSLQSEEVDTATSFLDATKPRKHSQQLDDMDDENSLSDDDAGSDEEAAPPQKKRRKHSAHQEDSKPANRKKVRGTTKEEPVPRKRLSNKNKHQLHLQDLGSSTTDDEEENEAPQQEELNKELKPRSKKQMRNKKRGHDSAVNFLADPGENEKPKHDISKLATKAKELAHKLKAASISKDFKISSTVADLKSSELAAHMATKASSSSSATAAQTLLQLSVDKEAPKDESSTENTEEEKWQQEREKSMFGLLKLKARGQLLLAKESPTTFNSVKSATKAAAAMNAAAAMSSSSTSTSAAVAANSNMLLATDEDAELGLSQTFVPVKKEVKKEVNMDLGTLNLIANPALSNHESPDKASVAKAQDAFVKSKAKLALLKTNFAIHKALNQ